MTPVVVNQRIAALEKAFDRADDTGRDTQPITEEIGRLQALLPLLESSGAQTRQEL